jgi:hypothetical protein
MFLVYIQKPGAVIEEMLTVHLGDDVGDPLSAVGAPHVGAHHHNLHLHSHQFKYLSLSNHFVVLSPSTLST